MTTLLRRLRRMNTLLVVLTVAVLVPLVGLVYWSLGPGKHIVWSRLPQFAPTSTPLPPTLTATPTQTMTRTPTATVTCTPSPTNTATPTPVVDHVLKVPIILQELPLSCEFAGMRMVAATLLGDAPSEKELLACVPRNSNPNLGFRGDPSGYNRFADGTINWDNYGVYAPAVAASLNKCILDPQESPLEAVAVDHATYDQVAKSILNGYPVIVWVTKREQVETTQVETPEGSVQLVMGEHVWVVVGYHEDGTFDVNDPYPQKNGVQTFRVQSFPNWELFGRMAVFVSPKPTP